MLPCVGSGTVRWQRGCISVAKPPGFPATSWQMHLLSRLRRQLFLTEKRLTTICASLRSYATAVTDSRQFARRYAPSNCVRWCNSCSLPPRRGSQESCCHPGGEAGLRIYHFLYGRRAVKYNRCNRNISGNPVKCRSCAAAVWGVFRWRSLHKGIGRRGTEPGCRVFLWNQYIRMARIG